MPPSIVDRVWTIKKATTTSPFGVSDTLKITSGGAVTRNGSPVATASVVIGADKVTVFPTTVGGDEFWELVLSQNVGTRATLYGMRWVTTSPDAVGVWVCDPQGP